MGSLILTAASHLACAHGGSAMAVGASERVTVLGASVLRVGDPVVVAACRAVPPCTTLRLMGSSRVLASGQPVAVALATVSSTDGRPAVVASTQQRVLAD